MSITKKLIIIMQLLGFTISGNGCAKGESIISDSEISIQTEEYTDISTTEGNVSAAEAVFETIPAPENGWTEENIESVLYINNRQISLPFVLNDLGDECSVADWVEWFDLIWINNSGTADLNLTFNGEIVGIMEIAASKAEEVRTGLIKKFVITPFLRENNIFPIYVNGITLGSSHDDVIKAFGSPSYITEPNGNYFIHYICGEYLFTFRIKEKKVEMITIEEKDQSVLNLP